MTEESRSRHNRLVQFLLKIFWHFGPPTVPMYGHHGQNGSSSSSSSSKIPTRKSQLKSPHRVSPVDRNGTYNQHVSQPAGFSTPSRVEILPAINEE